MVRERVPGPLLPRGPGARRRGQRELNARSSSSRRSWGSRSSRRTTRISCAREDHDSHDVLLCIGLEKDRARRQPDASTTAACTSRARPKSPQYFRDHPEVLDNTLAIADGPASRSRRSTACRRSRCRRGVEVRERPARAAGHGGRARTATATPLRTPADVQERLDYELGVITKTGYAGYFLIVADFIRRRAIRGSRSDRAAGRRPVRSSRTRCASPTSARSSSISSSSAS